MREIRTLGLMRRDWRRVYGGAIGALPSGNWEQQIAQPKGGRASPRLN